MKARPETLLFFFDEGRFGLKPTLGKYWAKKGATPVTKVRLGFENFYVYSAVSPTTGESVSIFLPQVNTSMMNTFLEHLSKALKGRKCLLAQDQAGWHNSKDLKVPENIEFVFLPPYSPELNPVERLWRWLKCHSLRNRFYENLNDIMDSVQACINTATPTFLKSLCRCGYISH